MTDSAEPLIYKKNEDLLNLFEQVIRVDESNPDIVQEHPYEYLELRETIKRRMIDPNDRFDGLCGLSFPPKEKSNPKK